MKYNERNKKKFPKKKANAEIIVKLDRKVNDTKGADYKFRSGVEAFVQVPRRLWNKYPQKVPARPLYYPKVSAISSRRKD